MDAQTASPQRVTQLLVNWSQGDTAALAELTPLVYDDLRRLAHRHMGRQRPDHTLQTTALVHEAYLRLADQTTRTGRPALTSLPSQPGRCATFWLITPNVIDPKSVAAVAQDRVGRSSARLTEESKEIINLHEALESLATLDARKAKVVELKYFGGLNYDEIAEVLKISPVTVRRDWEFAKVWLYANCRARD
jgi:RNA polymerase sigma factor (sigma-70 family)